MDKEIGILIIDDEASVRRNLSLIIQSYCDGFQVAGQAKSALGGLKQINELKPEIVLLDIEMPGGSGFDMLDCLANREFEVIFVTAYNLYAIKAFKYSAIDYLLKPVDIDELSVALNQAKKRIQESSENFTDFRELFDSIRNEKSLKLAINNQHDTEFVDIDSIVRMEASGSYTKIYLDSQREIVASKPLIHFESVIDEDFFVRTHHSHLINMNYVQKYLKKDGYFAVMNNGVSIPVAVRRKHIFEELILRFTK